MCLIVVLFRVVDDAPLIVGANREEAYERGGEVPALRVGPVHYVAGRDPTSGGTWLGVNAHGLVVAVTNRRKSSEPETPRSRGLLVTDLLGCGDAAEATAAAATALATGHYRGCSVLCADFERVSVIHGSDWLRVRMLPAGVHALANADVDADRDPRVQATLHRLNRTYANAEDALTAVGDHCADAQGPPPICWHGFESGTVSSTLIALREPLSASTLRHAQGMPAQTGYRDQSALLRELFGEG